MRKGNWKRGGRGEEISEISQDRANPVQPLRVIFLSLVIHCSTLLVHMTEDWLDNFAETHPKGKKNLIYVINSIKEGIKETKRCYKAIVRSIIKWRKSGIFTRVETLWENQVFTVHLTLHDFPAGVPSALLMHLLDYTCWSSACLFVCWTSCDSSVLPKNLL